MARRRMSGCKRMASKMKRRATKNGINAMHLLLFGEEAPKSGRRKAF